MNQEIINIRNEYVETNAQLQELFQRQRELTTPLREILNNEPDIEKRKAIIDFVFEGKVEEVHEHALRQMYAIISMYGVPS